MKRPLRRIAPATALVPILSVVLACGADPEAPSSDDFGPPDAPPAPDADPTAPDADRTTPDAAGGGGGGGPVILSLGANRTKISGFDENKMLTVSAVLTDPDGIDDLIGGQLYLGDAALGAFQTAAAEGAYALTLDWQQITVAVAEFPAWNEPLSLSLQARFYDVSGHQVAATLNITLSCDDADGTLFGQVDAAGCAAVARCDGGTYCYAWGATCGDACAAAYDLECDHGYFQGVLLNCESPVGTAFSNGECSCVPALAEAP